MSPQAFTRASPRISSLISRRAFHATRARLSSPYHYPEGPYSNLPFNTKTRFFAVRYWLYCITGFFAPFGIAGASIFLRLPVPTNPSAVFRLVWLQCSRKEPCGPGVVNAVC
ncbi:hypothetical protein RRF57_008297 [Xylaria bambusicola]|uniref:Cytochrome c oxidase subunit 8, mitochondrial n=1 Tax=Xylaria bambusicola TaxID=326684 RepID=A0AAN7UTB5_9PEZI